MSRPDFWVIQTFNGLSYGALLFLLASGLSLIFGVMRIVNLAHGSYFMLGGYVGLTVALRYLVNTVGAERVALGTDFCFDMGLERPLATIGARAVGLSKKDQDRVIRATGARLLRLR